jgi:Mn-dependent DtxR family transcriptional regulator
MTRRKRSPIPHARNKKVLALLQDMKKQGLVQMDEKGVWTSTEAGEAKLRQSSEPPPRKP